MNYYLEYYYNIKIKEKLEYRSTNLFFYQSYYYCFTLQDKGKINYDFVINCSKELRKKGFNCHEIVINRFNSAVSMIKKHPFILLKIFNNNPSEIVDFYDLIRDNSLFIVNNSYVKNYNHNWGILWQKKVDFAERQIRLLAKQKTGIVNSFSYYDGLAENAIVYFLSINNKYAFDSIICLSHRRIMCPNIWLDYANPLLFLFDIQERDLAEYLKYLFFYGDENYAYYDFDYLIKSKKMSRNSLQMLFARLLFPTYYFDIFDAILLDELSEDKLIPILNKAINYERYLSYIYKKISSFCTIEDIPGWFIVQH